MAALIYATPASPEAVEAIVGAPEGPDTRSEWLWLQLPDGSIMLATFPTGDTYEKWSQHEAIDELNAKGKRL